MIKDRIFKLIIFYFFSFLISVAFMFLPWEYENEFILGVEIIFLIPLFTLYICFIIASSVLYLIYHLYPKQSKILYMVGFGLGLGGSVFGAISGIFGIYYFFIGIRRNGVFLLGSCLYWLWDAILTILCPLIFVKNRHISPKTVPVIDL